MQLCLTIGVTPVFDLVNLGLVMFDGALAPGDLFGRLVFSMQNSCGSAGKFVSSRHAKAEMLKSQLRLCDPMFVQCFHHQSLPWRQPEAEGVAHLVVMVVMVAARVAMAVAMAMAMSLPPVVAMPRPCRELFCPIALPLGLGNDFLRYIAGPV